MGAPAPTSQDLPTEIFLPEFHFPRDKTDVQISGGKFQIGNFEEDGQLIQKLKWWHGEGKQEIVVKGVVTKLQGMMEGVEEEIGYYEALGSYAMKCSVM